MMSSGPTGRVPRPATAKSLATAAHQYVRRFDTTEAHLRRVLMRRVARSIDRHGTDLEKAQEWVSQVVAHLVDAGIVDDSRYAVGRARALFDRGASPPVIRQRLVEKGVAGELIDAALEAISAEHLAPELAAGINLARRRRLGPYRAAGDRPSGRARDLAAMARAGFDLGVALQIVDAVSTDELEQLPAPDDIARIDHE